LSRIDARFGSASRDGRRPGRSPDGQGVPAAPVPDSTSRTRALARRAAHRRLGLSVHRRHTHRGRAHSPPPRETSDAGHGHRDHQAVRLQTRRTGRPVTLRTRTFVNTLAGAAVALAVVTLVASVLERRRLADHIETDLVARTRLAAALLAHRPIDASADEEASRIAALTGSRVTFIDGTGRVVGDSSVDADDLAGVDNHGDRPEVIDARRTGLGHARRYSRTAGRDFLYAAAIVESSPIAFVRLALPFATLQEQLAPIWRISLLALGAGLLTALLLAWLTSTQLANRVRAIAEISRRYSQGQFPPPSRDFGDDELGEVARALDAAVQELARRLDESRRTRAHMEALLAGMFEGVVLINGTGRLLIANEAARSILRLPAAPEGQHIHTIVRQP